MNTDFQRVKSIFLAALEKDPGGARSAYLNEVCGQDTELKQRVEALLARHEAAGSFLESPASAVDPYPTVDEPADPEQLGMVIGPYKLLQQIGEGGMGTVYLAEQTRPVQRKVALKIIRPGMDSRQVIARFEAERQALALMDHPNIAKVLDAGTTDSPLAPVVGGEGMGVRGRPYFVMELVKGVSITKYCDEHHLTPRERLELFVPVCQAVQHAHQKGIIHRDLKPSNVLVALYDGKPVPKVIDFGVAKAMGQKLTDETLFTQFGQVVGTLEYMSPEQAEPNQLDIDTRSDIYSLGVLLYELLTGTTPIQRKRLKEAAILEALRIIREEEPPKPSTRLSTTEELPSIAANRGLEPKKLSGLVRGELDWIVMKALEKDRNRRYETAKGLAHDIERYLHDEPVQACPPSAGYRLKKFVRRNRGPVSAVGVVLLGFMVGVAGAVVGLVRAREEADGARQARDAEATQNSRAQQNLRSALRVLDEIYLRVAEDRVPRDPQQEENEHEMLKNALVFYREFAEQNSTDPAVSLEVVRANRRVGDIERLVGQHAGAGKAYTAAIVKAEQLIGDLPGKPEYSYELAAVRNALGELFVETGELATADEQFRQAAGALRQLASDLPAVHEYRAELARSHHGLGLTLKQRGERSAAEEEFRQAIDLQGKLAAAFPAMPQYRVDLAQMHRHAGRWYRLGPGDDRVANEHLRSAIKILRELVKGFPAQPLYRYQLAAALGELTIQGGPENHWQESIALLTQLANDFPTVPAYGAHLTTSYHNMAYLQMCAGDFVSAAEPFGKAFELIRKLAADFPKVMGYRNFTATSLYFRASMLIVRDKELAKARPLLEQALQQWRDLAKTYPHNQTYATYMVQAGELLAGVLAALGRPAEAAKQRQEAEQAFSDNLAEFEKSKDATSVASFYCREIASGLVLNGNLWMRIDRSPEATTSYRFAIKAYGKAMELDPKSLGVATDFQRLGLGWGFQGEGKRAAIKKAAQIIAKLLEEIPDGPVRKRLRAAISAAQAWSYHNLAMALSASKQPDEAEKAYRDAIALWVKLVEDFNGEDHRVNLAYNSDLLGLLLKERGRFSQAAQAFREARTVWHKLFADFGKDDYRRYRSSSHAWLLEALLAQSRQIEKDVTLSGGDRRAKAEKLYREAAALVERFAADCSDAPEDHDTLARGHYNLAEFLRNSGRSPEAEKAYRQAMLIWAKLATEHPEQREYRQHLAYAHWNLADALKAQKRLREAEEIYRQALTHWQSLLDHWPDEQWYRQELAFSHGLLGDLLKTTKHAGEAEKAYGRALALEQELVAAATTNAGYRSAWRSGTIDWASSLRISVGFRKQNRSAVKQWPSLKSWRLTLLMCRITAGILAFGTIA
jgi:serine/threonine protein kinase/tetratricopeptide (TPR) repeat protein